MAPNSLLYLFVFIFGLLAGSFLNSLIYRLEQGLPFPWLRSFCPKCRYPLAWYDLIPLLSFLFLKGRCRYCRKKISWQYPVVEITTALLFLSILIFIPDLISGIFSLSKFIKILYLLFIASLLIVIFVYDLKHYIIPDITVYPAIGAALIFNFNKSALFSALGAAAFFLTLVLISRGKWMGMGDVKLAFLIGLILGVPNILVAVFLAFVFGAIIGVGLIFLGKKTLKSELPFGPFLVLATFLALFWGHEIIKWYLELFI